jgi:hypothetical protein
MLDTYGYGSDLSLRSLGKVLAQLGRMCMRIERMEEPS